MQRRSPVVGVVGGGGTKGPLPGVAPEVDPPVGPPMGPGVPAVAPGSGERRGGVCAAGYARGGVRGCVFKKSRGQLAWRSMDRV